MLAVVIPDPDLARGQKAPPPFALTSTDGVGLEILGVQAVAAIEDPLAVTELHLTFENPEDRTIEGRFTFTVPEGASLSRLAMRVHGTWQEGEVVEKQRARMTYEQFLHARRDPALLEQGAGNEVAVRVFPIGPRERKEIIVTYAEPMQRSRPYRLRLAGLANVARLEAKVHARGDVVTDVEANDVKPEQDLTVPPERWSTEGVAGLRAGKHAVVRVRVPSAATAARPIESAVFLVDTSASRALDLVREIEAVRAQAAALPSHAELRVACFDQTVEQVYQGKAGAFDDRATDAIRARRALGASDLGAALAWAKAASVGLTSPRLLVFSDGVATAGPTERAALVSATKELGAAGVLRADAVAIGGIRDTSALAALTRDALPTPGTISGVEDGAQRIAQRIGADTLAPIPVRVEGAEWVYPSTLVGAQPGDEVLVHVVSKRGVPSISLGEVSVAPDLRDAPGPLVERAVALARIESLRESTSLSEDERRQQIVALSTKHRIVSEHTGLLVLETEHDYDRFRIDRTANVDILSVRGGKITQVSQPRGAALPPKPSPWESSAGSARGNLWGDGVGESFGAGGLGLSGVGEGGGGRGEGIGLGNIGTLGAGSGAARDPGGEGGGGRGAAAPAAPQVRTAATQVSGRIPPEVIQRIVRPQFGRLRACYTAAVGPSSTLSGRVVIRFTILRDGTVGTAVDQGSTLESAAVIRCVAGVFLTLTFPAPERGVVTVTYPIQFGPAAEEDPVRPLTLPPRTAPRPSTGSAGRDDGGLPATTTAPYEGEYASVMEHVREGDRAGALNRAWAWRARSPGDVLAFLALGEAAELADDKVLASRAYGSVLELWSYRVDMRRLAGQRLERVGDTKSLELAADAYAGAVADRPDHPSSHRLHAMALLKLDRPREAFEALDAALRRDFASGRFAGATGVLRDDLAIAGAAWARKEPHTRERVAERLAEHERTVEREPSIRFVLVWETDASDVDLHVSDARGDNASYRKPSLETGGTLSADVTNGYGPEAFAIPSPGKGFPYQLRVHYFARGSMGFGMGKVEILEHDGQGNLRFDQRPFVLMKDRAMIDLGAVRPSLLAAR